MGAPPYIFANHRELPVKISIRDVGRELPPERLYVIVDFRIAYRRAKPVGGSTANLTAFRGSVGRVERLTSP